MICHIKCLCRIISACYKWFWEFLLCREEPFTYQLTRMAVRHGVFFWSIFYIISGWCFYNIFVIGGWLRIIASSGGLVFLAWLTDHLLDQVHDKPGEY
jgi:hypothetical protein